MFALAFFTGVVCPSVDRMMSAYVESVLLAIFFKMDDTSHANLEHHSFANDLFGNLSAYTIKILRMS